MMPPAVAGPVCLVLPLLYPSVISVDQQDYPKNPHVLPSDRQIAVLLMPSSLQAQHSTLLSDLEVVY